MACDRVQADRAALGVVGVALLARFHDAMQEGSGRDFMKAMSEKSA
jgi:hypothetical protein